MRSGLTNTTRPPRSTDVAQGAHRIGHAEERRLAHARVGADHEEELGALEVGDRVGLCHPVQQLGGRVLVRAVLAGRREHAVGPEGADELDAPGARHRVERVRVAEVETHGARAVLVDQRPQLRGDLLGRFVPRDVDECVTGRVVDPALRCRSRAGSRCTSAATSPLLHAKPCVTGWSWSGRSSTRSPASSTCATSPQPTSQSRQKVLVVVVTERVTGRA